MPLLIQLDAIGAVIVTGLLAHWVLERERLRTFVRAMHPLPPASIELALQLARRLADRRMLRSDPPYISTFFSPVGSTASALIRHGGCCSGVSRLFMLCLAELGVRANQVTVFSTIGEHCLVEVHPRDGPAIVDPVYAVFYTDGEGRCLRLEELQSGVQVEVRPIPGALVPGYLPDEYHAFDFSITKTANWKLSWQRRVTYSVLNRLTRGAIDRVRVPQLLEWPQTLLSLAVVTALLASHSLVGVVAWLSGTGVGTN